MNKSLIATVLTLLLALSLPPLNTVTVVEAEACVVPESGPWPPCATGGSGEKPVSSPSDDGCVIPESGPWPPCATGGSGGAPVPPSSDGECVIPESGPWPPCATGGGSQPTPTLPTNSDDTGRVTDVVDGDTLVANIDGGLYSVRLIGIDSNERGQPCFDEATRYLGDLILDQTVRLERDISETDQFDRILRYLYIGETFINGEMVKAGMARAEEFPPDTKHAEQLANLEQQAQDAQRGCLWQQAAEPPPSATEGTFAITHIFYDGEEPRREGDEYAEITNVGGSAANLAGWRLNAGDRGQDFTFPEYWVEPGESCRVYTDEVHPEHCGFSYGRNSAIWNNKGDCGYLYNPNGDEVSELCYD